MASRAEVTSRYAKAYVKASKKDKGLVLDQVVAVTGWSRDNADGVWSTRRRGPQEAATRSPGNPAGRVPGSTPTTR